MSVVERILRWLLEKEESRIAKAQAKAQHIETCSNDDCKHHKSYYYSL